MTKKHSKVSRQNSNNKLSEPVKKSVVVSRTEAFSGPLPPPALFEAYERALPGCADRIVRMAEKEQLQQHKIQHKVVEANVGAERLGMIFGFVFQMVLLVGLYAIAGLLLFQGKDTAGLIALFTALAGSGVFIYRTATIEKPPKKKDDTQP